MFMHLLYILNRQILVGINLLNNRSLVRKLKVYFPKRGIIPFRNMYLDLLVSEQLKEVS